MIFETVKFRKKNINDFKHPKAKNWPVVYTIYNRNNIYIGETNHFISRMNQHLKDTRKSKLSSVHLITDEDFNKSAILNIESKLISLFDADKKYTLLNISNGVRDYKYYNKQIYIDKIPKIWNKFLNDGMADKDIFQLENTDLFKYSPYKTLSEDQFFIASEILHDCINKKKSISIINGDPGTGKTILAIYLLKILVYVNRNNPQKNIALVISMVSLRKTIKKVAKTVKGLHAYNVISPFELKNKKYDIVIVDEAHRLKRRVNITNYNAFNKVNSYFNLDKEEGTQLDWVKKSNHIILFYDKDQTIKPTDVREKDFNELDENSTKIYYLKTQHRVKGGREYVKYIKNILDKKQSKKIIFNNSNYEAYIVKDYSHFTKIYNEKEKNFSLTRMVAGYSFEWVSKKDNNLYDININGISKKWNTVTEDWVNSKNAKNEIGCIHTIQGYELDYVFVIFGEEIDYDNKLKKIVINENKYFDKKGKSKIKDNLELKKYIINIYKTLSTRGIKGIYMYCCNKGFEKYLEKYFNVYEVKE